MFPATLHQAIHVVLIRDQSVSVSAYQQERENEGVPTRMPINLRAGLAPGHLVFLLERMDARRGFSQDFDDFPLGRFREVEV